MYTYCEKTFKGFSPFKSFNPNRIIAVVIFEGEPELYVIDGIVDTAIAEIKRMYMEMYEREPERITIYQQRK